MNDLDHMISLDTVKKKISKILLNLRFLLMILFNVFFVTLFFFFLELNIKLSILLSDVFHDLLCICQNYLNQFFVNFSLMGVRQIFSYITSFCILSFLIWLHIYFDILIFVILTFLSCCIFNVQHSYHIV